MPTQAEIERTINRILRQTDWKHYQQMVSWGVRIPNCPFYEGKDYVCGYWQEWLQSGRRLYPQGKEGDEDFLKEVSERTIRIGYEKYPQNKKELEKRCRELEIICSE